MPEAPPDPSIVDTAEDRARALGGDPAQEAAADGLQAGLEAKRAKNAGEAPPPEAPQTPSEPAQPPQAAVAVAGAPPAEQPAPGAALGLDIPAKTITSAGTVEAPVKEEQFSPVVRKFACAKQPNGKLLVRAGRVMQVVDPNSPGGLKQFARDGDKFVRFMGGVSEETRDLEIIAFCERHPDIYDVNDPKAGLQFDLEMIQTPTATREAVVIPGVDIGRVLSGESLDDGLSGDSPIAAARRQVREANERT